MVPIGKAAKANDVQIETLQLPLREGDRRDPRHSSRRQSDPTDGRPACKHRVSASRLGNLSEALPLDAPFRSKSRPGLDGTRVTAPLPANAPAPQDPLAQTNHTRSESRCLESCRSRWLLRPPTEQPTLIFSSHLPSPVRMSQRPGTERGLPKLKAPLEFQVVARRRGRDAAWRTLSRSPYWMLRQLLQ